MTSLLCFEKKYGCRRAIGRRSFSHTTCRCLSFGISEKVFGRVATVVSLFVSVLVKMDLAVGLAVLCESEPVLGSVKYAVGPECSIG